MKELEHALTKLKKNENFLRDAKIEKQFAKTVAQLTKDVGKKLNQLETKEMMSNIWDLCELRFEKDESEPSYFGDEVTGPVLAALLKIQDFQGYLLTEKQEFMLDEYYKHQAMRDTSSTLVPRMIRRQTKWSYLSFSSN